MLTKSEEKGRFTMQRETFRTTSRNSSETSTDPHHLAYATQRANILFGCYRRGDANDPERYVASIAAILTLYDADTIREATDPRTGIQTSEKYSAFMPNAGELKAYCEAIAARKERLRQLAAIPRPLPADRRLEAPPAAPGSWANVHVPEWHPRYAKMTEWAKTAEEKFWRFGPNEQGEPGLWVPLNIWDGPAKKPERPKSDPDWANLKASPELLHSLAQRIEPESEADAA